jgi:hypothetical protein
VTLLPPPAAGYPFNLLQSKTTQERLRALPREFSLNFTLEELLPRIDGVFIFDCSSISGPRTYSFWQPYRLFRGPFSNHLRDEAVLLCPITGLG